METGFELSNVVYFALARALLRCNFAVFSSARTVGQDEQELELLSHGGYANPRLENGWLFCTENLYRFIKIMDEMKTCGPVNTHDCFDIFYRAGRHGSEFGCMHRVDYGLPDHFGEVTYVFHVLLNEFDTQLMRHCFLVLQ